MAKKLSGHKLMISALIALWVVITIIVLDLLHIQTYWPTFAVLNLLTIIGFTRQNIVKIFTSCIAGIALSLLYVYACGALTPMLGVMASQLLMLFLLIFVILALDEALPVCLNVHTIIVFTFCMVNAHEFSATWIHTVISAVVGGGIALAGVLWIIKISSKLAEKKAAQAIDH